MRYQAPQIVIKLENSADCYKTGRLKRGYGVEEVLKMLRKNKNYSETHNAVFDALDELEIIQRLGHNLDVYDIALISEKKPSVSEQQKKTKPAQETKIKKSESSNTLPKQHNKQNSARKEKEDSSKKKGVVSKIFGKKKG